MCKENYAIKVELESGKRVEFNNLYFEKDYKFETEILSLEIKKMNFNEVIIKVNDKKDHIKTVAYKFVLFMNNYSKIIAPDSGRWFLRNTSLIDFWKNSKEFSSNIGDIKIPLFMFLKDNGYVGDAVGIIGQNRETSFKIIEPESNRALNVHTGHITLEITKGNKYYPLHVQNYVEGIYYFKSNKNQKKAWMMVQREFSEMHKKKYNLEDSYNKNALEPMWCSWVDWDSKDINSEMLLDNMALGVELGIKNFIVDDGWYGNGLDSSYSVDMNIGDWEPDPEKIPDMKALVDKAHQLGAHPFIWCAPHAVAKNSNAFKTNYQYLLSDKTGTPIMNEPQYYSYCFQCPESREIMANICVKLIEKWGFDGSKYDLFNWVPNIPCENPNHTHDVNSMIEGLEMTLKLIHEKTRKINPEHMVELKQNYGTVFNMQYGNLMRAGDSPFDLETNFQRTIHIQSYTPYALNDYQTFTENDTAENVACMIIKMLAAGVPAYGMNFAKLSNEVKEVIKYYNKLYSYNLDDFKNSRIPLTPNYSAMLMKGTDIDYLFLLPQNNIVEFEKDILIFNGTYKEKILLKNNSKKQYFTITRNCYGQVINRKSYDKELIEIEAPIGGIVQVLNQTSQDLEITGL